MDGILEPFDGRDIVVGIFGVLVLVVGVAAVLVIVAQLVRHHLVTGQVAVALFQFQQLFQIGFRGIVQGTVGGKILVPAQGDIE